VCYICECGYFSPKYEGFSSHQKREHGTTSHPSRRIDRHFYSQAKAEINVTLPADFPHAPLQTTSSPSTADILSKMSKSKQVRIVSPIKSPKKPVHERLGAKTALQSQLMPVPVPAARVFKPSSRQTSHFKKAIPSSIAKTPIMANQRSLVVNQLNFPKKDQATSPMKIATPSQYKRPSTQQRLNAQTARLQELQRRNKEHHRQIAQNDQEIQLLVQQISQEASRLVGEDVVN
jgi:hypothetical protein